MELKQLYQNDDFGVTRIYANFTPKECKVYNFEITQRVNKALANICILTKRGYQINFCFEENEFLNTTHLREIYISSFNDNHLYMPIIFPTRPKLCEKSFKDYLFIVTIMATQNFICSRSGIKSNEIADRFEPIFFPHRKTLIKRTGFRNYFK